LGHQRLGRLPQSKKWAEVIDLLQQGADVGLIAEATSAAAEGGMVDASRDPAVRHAFWLLTRIPPAARTDDFAGELRSLGLAVSNDPSLAEVVTAAVDAVDGELLANGGRSDYGELAELAFAESLYSVTAREPDLLGETSDRVRSALARLSSANQFAALARDFFARLTRRHFAYFLSRELVNHTGPQQRFRSLRDQAAFEESLDIYCRETLRIIKEFAADWFYKHNTEGGIDRAKAGRFVHVASRKIRDELRVRRARR
jgi:hypothetical protein